MTSAPRLAPSSLNCTPTTPTLSVALTATVIVPATVAPAAGEVRATAVAGVAVERELRHGEDGTSDIGKRARHLARIVVEDAKPCDLGGEPLAVFRPVIRADADEDHKPAADLTDAFVADVDRCRADALDDRAR